MTVGRVLALLLLTALQLSAQEFMPLWPDGETPNSRGMLITQEEERQRISRVAVPGMFAFWTSQDEQNGSAVLICPPGGYHHLAYQVAGFQLAKWCNTLGMHAFVLIHRLPTEPDLIKREEAPIQDAQRALKLIRANADAWHIDPQRIGSMGASAGGHLAASLGTMDIDYSRIGDTLDTQDFRPNFMLLISPVITMGPQAHAGSRDNLLGPDPTSELIRRFSCELQVDKATPPAFLVHAQDDPVVPCTNSLLFYQGLLENQIPASLHIFPEGKHNIALRNNPGSTNLWTALCEAWLRQMGFL